MKTGWGAPEHGSSANFGCRLRRAVLEVNPSIQHGSVEFEWHETIDAGRWENGNGCISVSMYKVTKYAPPQHPLNHPGVLGVLARMYSSTTSLDVLNTLEVAFPRIAVY